MKVPSPGESISEVEIAEWLVEDGEFVEKDQSIAEIDSETGFLSTKMFPANSLIGITPSFTSIAQIVES